MRITKLTILKSEFVTTASNTAILALLTILLCVPLLAAIPLDERAAAPDEWGYRPDDGAVVALNPPTFTWLAQPDAASYTVQWSADETFRTATTADGVVWPTYTHHQPLAPGTWFWRYRYVDERGEQSEWSRGRRVIVPPSATELPLPTMAQQRARIPASHPRLFLRPEDLPRLRELARGREAEAFDALRKAADAYIEAGPTPEPEHRGSASNTDPELHKYWWPNRLQTVRACIEAETIAFVYLLTGDKRYGEAARRWVLHLASWDPKGNTNFTLNCEAAKPMLFRPARAYDWAWDMFSAEERARIQAVMRERVIDAWNSRELQGGVGHLQRPYGSHANRTWHKVAEAGIAFFDEIPEAAHWVDYALNKFFACYPVWSDDDGGWHPGLIYWSSYQERAVWWLQVAQSALQMDVFKKPYFSKVGDFALYLAPPNAPDSGFGDISFRRLEAPGFMEYHLRVRGSSGDGGNAGYWRWWAEQKNMRPTDGFLGFLYRANLPPLPEPKAPTDLPRSKIFRGTGFASLHTTLLDSRDDVHFLFKSSPLGSVSHGHNPQNSFHLSAYGEVLLVACGYRDRHGSRFHKEWVHTTRAQNAVLVNGRGQIPHSVESTGRIVRENLTDAFDYIAGDATVAYGGRLEKAWRHVAFVRGVHPFIVIYDELIAPQPATFQFMLHGLSPFAVAAGSARLRLDQPNAGVEAAYFSPVPLAFVQTDGFDPPPDVEYPNHWHVEAATTRRERRMGMITLLVPYRSGKVPVWSGTRRDEAAGIDFEVAIEGRRHVFRFPVPGENQPVNIQIESAN